MVSTNVGYKKLRNDWIAKLEILGENNESRVVVDSNYAKYRTSKARVLKIFKYSNDKIKVLNKGSVGSIYTQSFRYRVGEVVEAHFDPNVKKVCGSGIHYYKTLDAARRYRYQSATLIQIIDGCRRCYDDDGRLLFEMRYNAHKQEHGVETRWFDNGKILLECVWNNGVMHGLERRWNFNGTIMYEKLWDRGELVSDLRIN